MVIALFDCRQKDLPLSPFSPFSNGAKRAETVERLIYLAIVDASSPGKWSKMVHEWCGNGFVRVFMEATGNLFAKNRAAPDMSRVLRKLWKLPKAKTNREGQAHQSGAYQGVKRQIVPNELSAAHQGFCGIPGISGAPCLWTTGGSFDQASSRSSTRD